MPPWWPVIAEVALHPSAAGLAGSLLSMRWAGPSRGEKLFYAASGLACAVYLLPALCDWLGVHLATVRTGMGFVGGLLGMHLLDRTVEWSKTANWAEIATAASHLGAVLKGKKP